MVYNGLLYAHHHVPVHSIVVLLRPRAEHPNMDGIVRYAPRPGRGKMDFEYEVVRLWQRPSEELLAGDVDLSPLAVLGKLPGQGSLEEGLATVAQRLAERVTKEVPPDRARKLLTDALLLTGLRVSRNLAKNIFGGVRMLEESDTYLMILEQGEERGRRADILVVGEERFGPPDASVRTQLDAVTDLGRLKRMVRRAVKAMTWQEILDTP